jgi:3-oxoadipate enol-lactonase
LRRLPQAGRALNIVILHGVSGGASGFAPLVAALEAAGHRCLAWPAPGYDGTPPIAPYTLAGMAAVLEADLARHCIVGPVLVGHSMGGMLALECAATWTTPPAALVLACTVPAFRLEGAAQTAFLARRLAGIDAPGGMATTARALIPSLAAPGADPACVEAAQAVMAAIPAATYRLAVTALTDFDRRADLPRLGMPGLCVAGEADTVATPTVMSAMARQLRRGRYVELPGAGHLAPLEKPVEFAGLVARWLASLDEGS